jgi:type II secretory pathway pseudopilin PulG
MKLRRPSPSGFSLIEVTIALGIATFCLVALFALLPIGLNTNRDTVEQTIATSIAANIAADIRASLQAQIEAKKNTAVTPPNSDTSVNYKIKLPFKAADGSLNVNAGENGFGNGAVGFDEGLQYLTSPDDTKARYRAVVQYYPDTTNGNKSVSARIVVSWPASVDWTQTGKNPSGSVDTVTAFVAP